MRTAYCPKGLKGVSQQCTPRPPAGLVVQLAQSAERVGLPWIHRTGARCGFEDDPQGTVCDCARFLGLLERLALNCAESLAVGDCWLLIECTRVGRMGVEFALMKDRAQQDDHVTTVGFGCETSSRVLSPDAVARESNTDAEAGCRHSMLRVTSRTQPSQFLHERSRYPRRSGSKGHTQAFSQARGQVRRVTDGRAERRHCECGARCKMHRDQQAREYARMLMALRYDRELGSAGGYLRRSPSVDT
ncbi:hypothetical protein BD311DRAFT_89545 [Dichomitus squalens]|uniref:Uncharacterized protein n=1 Tax=Dichomitus squalens TaxID=114155 RepID=A0A4Q9MAN0_9APHY|nr:hypothetical protein BD311DRAFT_89545 [Dichomitus squalens]